MNRKKRNIYLILVFILLAALASACATSYRTSAKILGSSGEVRVQLKETSGVKSTSVEINEDWWNERLYVTATFSVEAGTCRATLSGDDGTEMVLDASQGNPAEAFGELVTDAFGDLSLQTDCQGGQNLDLKISFTL